ncbi:hypothetical protein ALI22I_20480 [Saccharothrix sp. ALI-22-I]|nr:hypothetical protein ALI22I_20480 [Saccharothrix sp. ALI-22-I]
MAAAADSAREGDRLRGKAQKRAEAISRRAERAIARIRERADKAAAAVAQDADKAVAEVEQQTAEEITRRVERWRRAWAALTKAGWTRPQLRATSIANLKPPAAPRAKTLAKPPTPAATAEPPELEAPAGDITGRGASARHDVTG